VRDALDKVKLNPIHDRVAKRYDFQHAFFTEHRTSVGGRFRLMWRSPQWTGLLEESKAKIMEMASASHALEQCGTPQKFPKTPRK